jgi:hypothetical protein
VISAIVLLNVERDKVNAVVEKIADLDGVTDPSPGKCRGYFI